MTSTTTRGAEAGLDQAAWRPDPLRRVCSRPLPGLGDTTPARVLCRQLTFSSRRDVRSIEGLEHVALGRDPFIFVLNHSTKLETMFLPPLLIYLRDGYRIRFMADWNFQLVPGVGLIMRSGGVITVCKKPARPRILNVFKRFYEHDKPSADRAREVLDGGESVGIFREGRVDRDPEAVLPGPPGAARLSLESGFPIVPAGIRFPNLPPGRPNSSRYGMSLHIGPAMMPPSEPGRRASRGDVRAWHETIMRAIGHLSGKAWTPRKPSGASAVRTHADP